MTPEAKLTKRIIDYLKKLKEDGLPVEWVKLHISPLQRAGDPDLHVTYHGHSHWMEIKAGKRKATTLQEHRLEQWRKAGAVVGVVRSVEDVEMILGIE